MTLDALERILLEVAGSDPVIQGLVGGFGAAFHAAVVGIRAGLVEIPLALGRLNPRGHRR